MHPFWWPEHVRRSGVAAVVFEAQGLSPRLGIRGSAAGIIPPRPPPLQLFRRPLPPSCLPKAAMALSRTPWLPPLQLRSRPGPEDGESALGRWCLPPGDGAAGDG